LYTLYCNTSKHVKEHRPIHSFEQNLAVEFTKVQHVCLSVLSDHHHMVGKFCFLHYCRL